MNDDDPIMNKQQRIWLAAFLCWVAGAILLWSTCSGCAASLLTRGRSTVQQHAAAVRIHVTCTKTLNDTLQTVVMKQAKTGSGVIVSPTRILTAAHVVRCPDEWDEAIAVDPGDGSKRAAVVEIVLPNSDIARIQIGDTDSLAEWMTPIEIGPKPEFSSQICLAAMQPMPAYDCGIVQVWPTYYIRARIRFEHGNSGSGVYDSKGRLVGIVSALLECENKDLCEGFASPLEGREWLIP